MASQDNPDTQGRKTPLGIPPHPGGEEVAEYFLDLIIDTLQQLEPAAQGAFLQKFLKSLASVEVPEEESLNHWQEILRRRREFSERLGRPMGLETAALDYFGKGLFLRNPILLEYKELKRLRHNAATDPLTGLYNRRLFDEYLTKELNRSRRYQYPLALLLFDLRNFKQANDTYGHAVGDEVLRRLARACVDTVRGSDYPCRIGGDEFALVLPQSESQSARALAQRITQKFEQSVQSVAPKVGLGLDYGVASYPEDGEDGASLFEAGDRDLYAQKKKAHQGIVEPPAEPEPGAEVAAPPAPAAFQAAVEEPRIPAPVISMEGQQRRYDRISLEGTSAYGVLRNHFGSKVVRVLDLSFGGFSFLLDEAAELPETFHARLHVPILPAAEMKIRLIYAHRLAENLVRIGCCFAA